VPILIRLGDLEIVLFSHIQVSIKEEPISSIQNYAPEYIHAMNFIYILLSLLLAHIAIAQSEHGIGNSHVHSVNKRGALAPGGDGVCYTYTIQRGETCAKLAKRYKITTSDIETWNDGSWGWAGCANVKQGDFVCLSSGALPMPVALPQATCGPQAPGTRRPGNYADLASLNPCPNDQCVSV
jgi:hypothetical protein